MVCFASLPRIYYRRGGVESYIRELVMVDNIHGNCYKLVVSLNT